MTILAGVAGWPIAQSLSPFLHANWIEAAGLDAHYQAFGPEDLAGFEALVHRGRAGALRGLNVTAPYKTDALTMADTVGPVAARCGSANLLLFDHGRIHADSTDGQGLIAALAEQAPQLDLCGSEVVVLGAGGAARAAVAALVTAGARVGILNRTVEKARDLADLLGADVVNGTALDRATLVVNAVSGVPDIDIGRLRDGTLVMDMSYRPLRTPLLAAAQSRGLTTVDGLAMLIGQARPSFTAFFGIDPPPVDIRKSALDALEAAS